MPGLFRRGSRKAFEKIEPPLPVTYWNQQSALFTFGVPSGWRDFSREQLDDLSRRNGARMLAGVFVEHTSSPTTDVIVGVGMEGVSENQFLRNCQGLASQRAQAVARQVVGTPREIHLNKKPALMIEMQGFESGQEWGEGSVPGGYTEIFAFSENHVFLIAMTGRVEQHAAYLPGLHTMLATWRWS